MQKKAIRAFVFIVVFVSSCDPAFAKVQGERGDGTTPPLGDLNVFSYPFRLGS